MNKAEEQELFYFCRVLFGLEAEVSRDFLNYIQISGLKTAYRRKVRETHPDMAAGRSFLVQRRHADKFLMVQRAYEKLTQFLEERDGKNGASFSSRNEKTVWTPGSRQPAAQEERSKQKFSDRSRFEESRIIKPREAEGESRKTFASMANGENWVPGMLFQGTVPARTLLFGHYLYYSGVITWKTIVDALVWQRKQRKRLGEIGCRMGWLTKADIFDIVRDREDILPFGEAAIRRGLLTDRQLLILLNQQKRDARKFGEYFLDQNIMTPTILARQLQEFNDHNLKYSGSVGMNPR